MLAATSVIGRIIVMIIVKNCSIAYLNYALLSNSVIDFLGQGSEKGNLDITYTHRIMGIGVRWGSEFAM